MPSQERKFTAVLTATVLASQWCDAAASTATQSSLLAKSQSTGYIVCVLQLLAMLPFDAADENCCSGIHDIVYCEPHEFLLSRIKIPSSKTGNMRRRCSIF